MPAYDFLCQKCSKKEEVFMKLADYKKPDCCDQPMKQIIGNYHIVMDLKPYLDENLSEQPVYVRSKKHRRQLMQEAGVTEKFGKGWF